MISGDLYGSSQKVGRVSVEGGDYIGVRQNTNIVTIIITTIINIITIIIITTNTTIIIKFMNNIIIKTTIIITIMINTNMNTDSIT